MSDQLKNYLRDLKARVYDKMAQMEFLEKQINQINQEIIKVSSDISIQRAKKFVGQKSEEAVGESKQLLTEKT